MVLRHRNDRVCSTGEDRSVVKSMGYRVIKMDEFSRKNDESGIRWKPVSKLGQGMPY